MQKAEDNIKGILLNDYSLPLKGEAGSYWKEINLDDNEILQSIIKKITLSNGKSIELDLGGKYDSNGNLDFTIETLYPNIKKGNIIKIYNIGGLIIPLYGKIRVFIKKQTFNLQNPLENQLARINSFYEVLNKVENSVGEILYSTLYYDKSKWVSEFTLDGYEDQGEFQILYDYEDEHDYKLGKDCFIVSYSEYQY